MTEVPVATRVVEGQLEIVVERPMITYQHQRYCSNHVVGIFMLTMACTMIGVTIIFGTGIYARRG